jgi:hypothetical protein
VWLIVTLNGETDVRIEADAGVVEGEAAVTVLDRFGAAAVSRETFDAALAAGRIAVAAERITDPATPAPPPTAVAIVLDAGETARGVVLGC